ncbi:RelA/SpoT family protein [Thiobacter aerophilum]|uniref:GTP pyrophosphokinase n=1 Tax=Thiobacter aerophilum TaxID=3121275 RepID=A0ABV0EB04_9BURK
MVSTARTLAPGASLPTRQAWLAAHAASYDAPAREALGVAFDLAKKAYGERRTPQGERLFLHALAVAGVIADSQLDHQAVAAALLAHVLDGELLAPETLAAKLGEDVLRLVQGVGRMDQVHRGVSSLETRRGEPVNQAESLRKMLLAMAEDIRVVLIILAEQVQLLRELVKSEHPARVQVAREAQEIFAPLANRLGIWQLKWELEDLALRILEPEVYKRMARLLDERRLDREQYIACVIEILRGELAKAGIQAEVTGRPKHIYSIWRKMKLKHLDFEQVYDVRAVRVLVNDVKDCYTVLGIVHGLWQPIPGEFDDYIAHPKANDYRSLHTAVIGPEGKALEVQIRTHEMHRHAEFGVAAHWRYKEGVKASQGFDEKIAWLRQLLAWRDEVAASGGDAGEWVQQFKTELFRDRVYVLTPQGKVIDLPQGATPLDFAYAVHTDLGHRCRGAKVDGHIVPLNYKLRNAQWVEILTAKQGGPSRDWLSGDYLVTSRARAKVRQWFHAQQHDAHLAQGRELLDKELIRLGVSGLNQEKLAQAFGQPRLEDFLVALGRGEYRQLQLEQAIRNLAPAPAREVMPAPPRRGPSRAARSDVLIEGVGSLPVAYGKCCRPVPPDPIVAYLTRARGAVVHRQDCPNVQGLAGERSARLLAASWAAGADSLHAVDLLVRGDDRPGLLRDLLAALAAEKMNPLAVNAVTGGGLTDLRLTIEVRDLEQLERLLAALTAVRGVRLARRTAQGVPT